MTAKDAAYKVLIEAGHPLQVKELTKQMLASGLWTTTGSTPAATVEAGVVMDIKQHELKSRFLRTAPSTFSTNPQHCGNKGGSAPAAIAAPAHPTSLALSAADVKSVSFAAAAEQVLRDHSGEAPMHYRDITEKAKSLGLLKTSGATPEATMYTTLLGMIERKAQRGEPPLFVRSKGGLFALAKPEDPDLTLQINKHNREVRIALRQRLFEMAPPAFEELIGILLGKLGFEDVEITKHSGDGGIDVRGTLVVGNVIRTRMAVQVKRWKGTVQAPVVQQVRGSLGAHEQGLIITTGGFSSGASKEAEASDKTPIALMNGDQLVELLVEKDIGVVRTVLSLLELAQEGEQ